MNKRKIWITLFTFFVVLFITNISYGKSYSIDDIDIQATILKNGSVNIKQKMTYTFNGEYNGIYVTIPCELDDEEYDSYRQQSTLKDSLYNNQGVKINGVNLNGTAFEERAYAHNGDKNIYQVSMEDGILKTKIYSPSYNETKTFQLDYTLESVCVKHEDVGELYYNFIGGKWDQTIKNLNIDIYLNSGNTSLKIWGHGNYNGMSKLISNNHANFKTSDVRKGEYVATRLVFDTNSIPDATKLSGIEANDLILQDEEIIGQNLETKKNHLKNTIIFCIVLFIYWIILLLVYEVDKKYKEYNFDEQELFKKYNPLIAGCLQGSRDILSRDIIAVILNLINKKVLTLKLRPKMSNSLRSDQYIYEVSENQEKKDEMDKIERYICDWLFEIKHNVDLKQRLMQIPKEKDANKKFENISILAKNYLNNIGANRATVPVGVRMLNNILLILTIIWSFVSVQKLVFNIFNNSELNMNLIVCFVCIIFCLPLIMSLLYIPLSLIVGMRRLILKKVQKFSGQKVISTTITIIVFCAIIMIITAIFSSVRGLILDELLLCIALIICLTDNLMLKNSEAIVEDFNKLNALKNKIKDYTMMDERDIEQIFLWNQYLAYAVSFGVAEKIMKRIDVMTIDDDLQKMVFGCDISYYVYTDYFDFYKEASLGSKFLKTYNENVSKYTEKWINSVGSDRRIFWWWRFQRRRRRRPVAGGAF